MRLSYTDVDSIQEQIIDQYEIGQKYYDVVKVDSRGGHHIFEVNINEWFLKEEIDELTRLHQENIFTDKEKTRILNNDYI